MFGPPWEIYMRYSFFLVSHIHFHIDTCAHSTTNCTWVTWLIVFDQQDSPTASEKLSFYATITHGCVYLQLPYD